MGMSGYPWNDPHNVTSLSALGETNPAVRKFRFLSLPPAQVSVALTSTPTVSALIFRELRSSVV